MRQRQRRRVDITSGEDHSDRGTGAGDRTASSRTTAANAQFCERTIWEAAAVVRRGSPSGNPQQTDARTTPFRCAAVWGRMPPVSDCRLSKGPQPLACRRAAARRTAASAHAPQLAVDEQIRSPVSPGRIPQLYPRRRAPLPGSVVRVLHHRRLPWLFTALRRALRLAHHGCPTRHGRMLRNLVDSVLRWIQSRETPLSYRASPTALVTTRKTACVRPTARRRK